MFKVHECSARECKIPRECWFLGQAWWDISRIFSQQWQQWLLLSAVALVWQHPPSAGWLTSLVTVPGDTGSTGSRGFSPTSLFFSAQLLLWPKANFCIPLVYRLELCLAVSADQKLLLMCLWLTPDWFIFFPSLSLRCFPVFQVPGLPLPLPRNTSGAEGNGFWCQYQNWWSSDGKITGANDLSLFLFFNNMVENYIWKLWILLKQEDVCP